MEYSQVLDELVEQESFTTQFQEHGAEFVSARTVKVPEMVFDGGTVNYDRFQTKGTAEIKYTSYELFWSSDILTGNQTPSSSSYATSLNATWPPLAQIFYLQVKSLQPFVCPSG